MKHLGTQYLETERLILRKFTEKDAKAMFQNWASDKEVTKYLMWTELKTEEESLNIIKEWIESYEKEDYYQWAIVIKNEGPDPIGCIGVSSYNDKVMMVHIGYSIGKKWWNQGITSEALKVIMDFFFDEVGVMRIESRHDPRNIYSGSVMKKCGMRYEGTLRMADWNNQGICDAAYYALLKSERE